MSKKRITIVYYTGPASQVTKMLSSVGFKITEIHSDINRITGQWAGDLDALTSLSGVNSAEWELWSFPSPPKPTVVPK